MENSTPTTPLHGHIYTDTYIDLLQYKENEVIIAGSQAKISIFLVQEKERTHTLSIRMLHF